jgi:MFS superfamily sulfate permease-like transporter
MNQSSRNLALIAGIALVLIGVIAYLTGHHRLGEGIALISVIAGGASFALPKSRTS